MPLLCLGDTMICADLHVGIERTMAGKGVRLPSGAGDMAKMLVKGSSRHGCKELLIMGDLKDQVASTSQGLEWELRRFFEALAPHFNKIFILRGNHDGGLSPAVGRFVKVISGWEHFLHGYGFIHGHTIPSEKMLGTKVILAGHTHPVVHLRDDLGVITKERCWCRFPRKQGPDNAWLISVPAFNPMCGGTPVNNMRKKLLGPVYSDEIIKRRKGKVTMLDGTDLGEVAQLEV